MNKGYELTPMGKAYCDLVFNKWMTHFIKTSDESGKVSERGFYGSYQFKLKAEGKVFEGTFEVLPNENNKLKINLQ